nr:zinc-ribbon domain-containing protein [uncultured Rhodopila sp.]
MQIACPSCAATYEVPAARLKPGRSVRCSACGAEWKPAPEAEPEPPPPAEPPAAIPLATAGAEPAAPPAPFLTAMERLAAEPSRPPRSPVLLAAWLVTFLLLASGGISAVVWRAEIMRVWPPSSHILTLFDRMPEKPALISGKNP